MSANKWDKDMEEYLRQYLAEHDRLDIEKICAERGVGKKSLRKNINKIAKPLGMRIEGLTLSLTPSIIKGLVVNEDTGELKQAGSAIKKTGASISGSTRKPPLNEQKFICKVSIGVDNLFLVCLAVDKDGAKAKILDTTPAITEVVEVRTVEEHNEARGPGYGKFSIGPGSGTKSRIRG